MQLRTRVMHLFQPRAMVLMYHRIASLKNDPWQLAVSPQNFEEQLDKLKEVCKIVSVSELVTALKTEEVVNHSVCLTFDDGYADNFLNAKPLLEKFKVPATFFIPTHYIGRQQQFWWDDLERIFLLQPVLPSKFLVHIKGVSFRFDLEDETILTPQLLKTHERWAWPAPAPSRRCDLYLSMWVLLRPLQFDQLQLVLTEIRLWANFENEVDKESLPMNDVELKSLADHQLITLGLHTHTHPALSNHDKQYQQEEVSRNKTQLESIYKKPLESIAYPYGDYNDTTIEVVKEAGIDAAFTTKEKIVSNLTDPYKIGRFQVRNMNGNEFEKWITKLKTSPQFL